VFTETGGGDRGAARHQQQLRAADHQEAPTPADIRRWNRIVLDRKGFDFWRDFGALRRRLRQQTLQLIIAAEALGQQRLAEMNRQVLHNLDSIITALNDPGPGKARHAGRQQHPPQPCRPAAARTRPCYTQTSLKDEIRVRAQHRPQPSTPLPARQRASDDSLRQRLESPTAATANCPWRTGGYAANSRTPLADSAPTPGDTRR
jgi:hypothetical protein